MWQLLPFCVITGIFMNSITAKEKLIEYLNSAINNIQIRKVIFAFEKPLPREPFTKHPHFRLSMVLDGRDKLIISRDGKIEKIEITPGEIVFFLYDGWALPVFPSTEAVHLSLVFYEDFLRIVGGKGKTGKITKKYWYHTSQGISRLGIHIIQALNSIAGKEHRQERACMLIKVLLITALEDLINDSPGDSSKTRSDF